MSTDIPFVTETDYPSYVDDDDDYNLTSTWNSTDVTNSTEATTAVGLNFLDSFVKGLTAMIVSELGDKTFFLAAILAMRYNKLAIFLGTIVSLYVMTVVSALVGFGITSFIPPIYTYYAAIVIMFLFGFKMFWDAYRMKPDEGDQLQKEVEDQVDNLDKKITKTGPAPDEPPPYNNNMSGEDGDSSKKMVNQLFNSIQFWKNTKPAATSQPDAASTKEDNYLRPQIPPPDQALADGKSAEEGSLLPHDEQPLTPKQKFFKLLKIFINTFGLIFIAEWGDRSQLATIVLASSNDVGGIILGSLIGHTICTILAVMAGALIARWISVRVVTVIGGIVFISFAIASLAIGFEDPAESIDSI